MNSRNSTTDRRITAAAVRDLCGGVTDMTLWRWQHSRELQFPAPVYISGRRYGREADILAWLDQQAGGSAPDAA